MQDLYQIIDLTVGLYSGRVLSLEGAAGVGAAVRWPPSDHLNVPHSHSDRVLNLARTAVALRNGRSPLGRRF